MLLFLPLFVSFCLIFLNSRQVECKTFYAIHYFVVIKKGLVLMEAEGRALSFMTWRLESVEGGKPESEGEPVLTLP